jgi:hypothetical protein
MTLISAIRTRLESLAAQALTTADVLADVDRIDLSGDELSRLLCVLDGIALRLDRVAGKLAGGVDPARLPG